MSNDPIKLNDRDRKEAIASIQRYFHTNLPEDIGDLAAGMLLDFILEDVGPALYNQGVRDAVARITTRAADAEGELYADTFQYWSRQERKRRKS